MLGRRVVVTGLGIVSSLGCTVEAAWKAILAGKSGVSRIERFDAARLPVRIASEVKDFNPLLGLTAKEVRRLDIFIQFAVEASRQAVLDSGLVIDESNAHRCGTAIGSGIGGLPWIENAHDKVIAKGPERISPFFIPGAIINMASGYVSIKHNLQGPNISVVTACTTGAHNIGQSARMIAYGDADVMVVGGAEMATSELGVGGFAAARTLSRRNSDPEQASRPFDKDRDGFVLGEGAGVLVLESYEHAVQRGAQIYAELSGFGMSADAYHMTSPDPSGSGFIRVLNNTLHDAGKNPEDIQYINAHGTSTRINDPAEAKAIRKCFGAHADALAVSSTKSMTGHLLGAAGAIEAIFSVLAIRDQVAPPTINLDHPDEGCDLDFVPHQARDLKIDAVLSNSFGFGGTNGCLLFNRI